MQLLLGGDQHGVPADHPAERALGEEGVGEGVEVDDLLVVFVGEAVDGQEALVGVEGEVLRVVVGEVEGVGAVADDEQLHEAQQRAGVAVAGVGLVVDDLLHRPAGAEPQRLELDLHGGHAVDEQHHVVAVVAVVGVDLQLADHLEGVLAPVLDVHQRVVERRAVVAGEAAELPQAGRGGEDVGGDDLQQQPLELGVGEGDAVEGLELLAEVGFEGEAVADVGAVGVLQPLQPRDEAVLDLLLDGDLRGRHGRRLSATKPRPDLEATARPFSIRRSLLPRSRGC